MRDAGRYAAWALAMQEGMRTGLGSDVPCDGCVACCTSGQTIIVDPDEVAVLPHAALRTTSDGDHALRHDDTGRCVLLVDGACTAYDVRPRRCRTYDCRIFPATGLVPEDDKPAIAARAAEWRFREETPDDTARLRATRMAAITLRSAQLGGRHTSATQLAAEAVAIHDELL